MRLDRQEDRPNHFPQRLAKVVDPGRIEIRVPVGVDVDADLDDADQLHQVDDGLTAAVSPADDAVVGAPPRTPQTYR